MYETRKGSAAFFIAAYVGILALITLWPTPVDRGASDLLDRAIRKLHENGVPEWVNYTSIEFGANILLFIPLGLFLALIIPLRRWYLVTLLTCAVSTSIELSQHYFLPERVTSVYDVIANTSGAIIGQLVVASLLRTVDREPAPRRDPARFG